MNKLLIFLVCFAIHLHSNEYLPDFKMVKVESVEISPNLQTQNLAVKITVLFRQLFQYQTFEFELGWDSIGVLKVKKGDLIGWRSQGFDFSKYGFSFYDVYFPDSNAVITGRGRSNVRMDLDENNPVKLVFELNEKDKNYLTFLSEGNARWFIDKHNFVELNNGDTFYIDYASERFAPNFIGASIYKISTIAGNEGEIVGKSSRDWQPDDSDARTFTVISRAASSYHNCHVTLHHDKTGAEVRLSGFSVATKGDKIVILGKSRYNQLIYYIVNKKQLVGNKDSSEYAQFGIDVNLPVDYIGWTAAFEKLSTFPKYYYW